MTNNQGGNGHGGATQNAGTLIQFVVPSRGNQITRVTRLSYLDSGTAHTITIMRPIGRTTVAGAAAVGQTLLNFTSEPGLGANTLAANDFVVIQEKDGIQRVYKISAVPTSYPGQVTLASNLVAGCLGNEPVWNYGITTDTGVDGNAHPFFTSLATSAIQTFTDSDSGIVAGFKPGDPLLLNSNNATNAGKLSNIVWCYTPN